MNEASNSLIQYSCGYPDSDCSIRDVSVYHRIRTHYCTNTYGDWSYYHASSEEFGVVSHSRALSLRPSLANSNVLIDRDAVAYYRVVSDNNSNRMWEIDSLSHRGGGRYVTTKPFLNVPSDKSRHQTANSPRPPKKRHEGPKPKDMTTGAERSDGKALAVKKH